VSARANRVGAGGPCRQCLRRSWLLAELGAVLERCARERARLLELLQLEDESLIEAVAGRRRGELRERHAAFDPGVDGGRPGVAAICRHEREYPQSLLGASAPALLHVDPSPGRLAGLLAAPAVAITGSTRASDYGREVTRGLARGLAASGVTVIASLGDGIALAAHAGALEARAGSVAVLGGGLAVSVPARRRRLYGLLMRAGCAVSELPADCRGRRWGALASERIVAGLASVTVLVEGAGTPAELTAARLARTLGRTVAAVPGRVSSPLSDGPHALLLDGAELVRGPHDVLELLARNDRPGARLHAGAAAGLRRHAARLPPRLRETFELVGAGSDTPDRLERAAPQASELLLSLSELELLGLLTRGDGGRYLPSQRGHAEP